MAYDAVDYINSTVAADAPGLSNAIIEQATPPANPAVGQRWRDTSITPPVLKIWDGANWAVPLDEENLDRIEQGIAAANALYQTSADRGDASVTLTPADAPVQRFGVALTATRTVTLPATADVFNGARFRIVRGPNATGAFSLEVRRFDTTLLATLTGPNQAAEFAHDGTAWYVTDFPTAAAGATGGDTFVGQPIVASTTEPAGAAEGSYWVDLRA